MLMQIALQFIIVTVVALLAEIKVYNTIVYLPGTAFHVM